MKLGIIVIGSKTYEAYRSQGYVMLLDREIGEAQEHKNLAELSRTVALLRAASER